MYWAWDIVLIAWAVGGALFVVTLMVTRRTSATKRVLVCSLILAVALTPSILVGTGMAVVPALFILIVSPFSPEHGFGYAALLGAVPIVVTWSVIATAWLIWRAHDAS